MRRIAFLLLFIITPLAGHAAVQRTGLRAAMDKGLVRVSAISTGAIYNGKALKLHLVNTSHDALQVTVDPALIFRPFDSACQDLVLPGSEMLALAPGASGELTVQTFCGKASAAAPRGGVSYRFKAQGDSIMIHVLQFIKKQQLFDGLGQSAVWALTDHHNLEGIVDPARPKVSADLLALMVKLTGWPAPEYFKVYKLNTEAGQPVFQKRVLKIVAKFDWALPESRKLTMGIFNEQGKEVQSVFKDQQMAEGGYKMQVEFEAEGAPAGKYYMRLKDGERVMKEVRVVVD
jgi:hypothetical protein